MAIFRQQPHSFLFADNPGVTAWWLGSDQNAEWQGLCRVLVPERVLLVRSSGQLCEVLMGTHVADYCSFAYSALACFRMGTSGSASFHSVRKS